MAALPAEVCRAVQGLRPARLSRALCEEKRLPVATFVVIQEARCVESCERPERVSGPRSSPPHDANCKRIANVPTVTRRQVTAPDDMKPFRNCTSTSGSVPAGRVRRHTWEAHNPEVDSSNLSPATRLNSRDERGRRTRPLRRSNAVPSGPRLTTQAALRAERMAKDQRSRCSAAHIAAEPVTFPCWTSERNPRR